MSENDGSWKKPLLAAELIAAVIGIVLGIGTRLLLVGTTSNEQILSSSLGLVVFGVIAYGLYGLLFGIQHKILLVIPRTAALMGGIMWVIPFPK